MPIPTKTDDGGGRDWRIADDVTHLRFWGSDERVALPPPPGPDCDARWTIGSADDAWLRLADDRVSRQHAELRRADGRWTIADLGSKNGVRQDGARRLGFPLAPGVEIGLGGVTLIADSAALAALREALQLLLGWAPAVQPAVDQALRSVRAAATLRDSLFVCGDGDLVAVARRLHAHALGEPRPFIVCDPRRRRSDPNARVAANYDSGQVALAAAAGGTLCVWQNRQPADFDAVLAGLRAPGSRVQLIVCTHAPRGSDALIASPVVVPPLASRAHELDRVIDAYGADAARTPGAVFAPADRAWIRTHESATHAQIEKAARRLVAIRAAGGSITRAAGQLEMSHGALSEWVARRTLPA